MRKMKAHETYLVNKNSQSPPIDCTTIPFRLNNFRCQIVGGSTQCPCHVRHILSKSKIGNLDMPLSIKKKILNEKKGFFSITDFHTQAFFENSFEKAYLWLQIPVNDIPSMQVIDGGAYFCSIELTNMIGEPLNKIYLGRPM
jgi:DNA polymerase II small subunit/DNA polymerase delta subunit B